MNIVNFPFTKVTKFDKARPRLPVRISNPHKRKTIREFGLIDTGADDCALPASYAQILGHNLLAGTKREVDTGNGKTVVYAHTVRIEIEDFSSQDVLIDFMPNLHVVLLGVNSFLSNFVLTINYPKRTFSLKSR